MKTLGWLVALCAGAVAWGDIIVLNDGTRLEGEIKRNNDDWVVVSSSGIVTNVPAGNVRSIQISPVRGVDGAREGLDSLRRSAENAGDLRQVITRYQQFIDKHKGTVVGDDAEKDLAVWKDRLERGLNKVGGQWVSPQKAAELAEHSFLISLDAKYLIQQGRLKEGEPLVQQALAEDPQNAAAWYLRGLLLYRRDQFPDARKSLEAVNSLVPDHAAALNNLAIVLWKQKQQAVSLRYFDEAMRVAPTNRLIMDNVAEALHGVGEQTRPPAAVAAVGSHFAEYDLKLQSQMEKQGLYRWGATWVNQGDLERLKNAEKEVRARMDAIQAEFDRVQGRLAMLDDEQRRNEREMNRIEASSLIIDQFGRAVRMPYPRVYYELLRDQESLNAERQALQPRLEALRQQAMEIQKRLPTPKYTGVLQFVGVEGMPIRAGAIPGEVAAPTTVPATVPSTRPGT